MLNSRGLDALAYGGVKLDDGLVVHLSGSVRHREKTGPVFSSSALASIAVDRGVLKTIVREAKEQYGDSIRFHFNKSLYGVNFNTQTAVFERFEVEDGESLYEEARTICSPSCRTGARDREYETPSREESAEFNVTQVVDGMKYKTIMLPKLADSHEWSRAFHTWSRGQCSLPSPPIGMGRNRRCHSSRCGRVELGRHLHPATSGRVIRGQVCRRIFWRCPGEG